MGCLTPNVWTDGGLVLDQVTVYPLLTLGVLLISLSIVGESVGGVMLIMSVLVVLFRPVKASFRSLGLCR